MIDTAIEAATSAAIPVHYSLAARYPDGGPFEQIFTTFEYAELRVVAMYCVRVADPLGITIALTVRVGESGSKQ